ncbi:DUF7130 family rubredoxin-like protein [Halococcoides cellulosivorans]|uniref:DUF7130 domain-containing protein n=1 Tax=Halococcoides cellulosivorans TaxID=1679096 RepID=A0A2R4X2U2_9EURY|nr:hypothetical protein [Halococcoides cellulosivorans]AWB28110.1 hypothetical protein HARCEL1_10525 [Halococcoides cellulosivorans]
MESEMSDPDVGFGQPVFDRDGNKLGTVRGFDDHGFHVSTDDGIQAMSSEHIASGVAGEAQLMWRCYECGEMGQIDDVPEACPSCGAPRESIYYYTDD